MLKTIPFTAVIAGALAAAVPAFAQDLSGGGNAAVGSGEVAWSGDGFEQMSPGNQMIAKSLFEAQTAPHPGMLYGAGRPRWSLEKISSERGDGKAWGEVFRQMKAEGLIVARSLGEVVSEYRQAPPRSGIPPAQRPRPVMITSGANDVFAVPPQVRQVNVKGGQGQSAVARPVNSGASGGTLTGNGSGPGHGHAGEQGK